jgi:LysR substrate binding domain
VPLKALAKLPLVLPSREHGMRIAFEQQMRSLGLTPRVEIEPESVVAIKQFVQAGGIYTILPRGEIEQEMAAGLLAPLVTRPAFQRTLSLAWARDKALDGSLLPLIEIVRQETAQLIQTGAWGTTFLGRLAPRPATRHSRSPPARAGTSDPGRCPTIGPIDHCRASAAGPTFITNPA